jgi:hypothetical protein
MGQLVRHQPTTVRRPKIVLSCREVDVLSISKGAGVDITAKSGSAGISMDPNMPKIHAESGFKERADAMR